MYKERFFMIKIAVCDDEEIMLSGLKETITGYLEHRSCRYEIHTYSDAEAMLREDIHYDIVFLDIQMNGMDGMTAARKLRESGDECFLVFVTVTREYVYDAFEVEASDYLLKPVVHERFARTMERILHYVNDRNGRSLTILKGKQCQSIQFADILYCEVINRKIYVHTKNQVIDYYSKIDQLEKQLDSCFFRCHRSYVVNLRYVCGCENDMAQLENGEQIPISRLRHQEFLSAVLHYMKDR